MIRRSQGMQTTTTEDSARVTADALSPLGRADEAAAADLPPRPICSRAPRAEGASVPWFNHCVGHPWGISLLDGGRDRICCRRSSH